MRGYYWLNLLRVNLLCLVEVLWLLEFSLKKEKLLLLIKINQGLLMINLSRPMEDQVLLVIILAMVLITISIGVITTMVAKRVTISRQRQRKILIQFWFKVFKW